MIRISFSRRTTWNRALNPLAARVESLLGEGRQLIDLTESNPTRCGFNYPKEEISAALNLGAEISYQPDPRGLPPAREAVANYLAGAGVSTSPTQVLLCSGTSEAYSYLFKLLCDPGDGVLVPRPGYPLLDFLLDLDCLDARPYPLAFDGSWHLDLDALGSAANPRTRCVVAINPGNPTGAFLKRDQWVALSGLCASRGWALIADEVFSDYGQGDDSQRLRTVLGQGSQALAFSLSGLSKIAGLPQLKLAWLVADGPAAQRDEALARLDLIADSYLSVATPVQRGLGRLLATAAPFQEQVCQRIRQNRAELDSRIPAKASWSALPAEGGWYAVLRIPRHPPEDTVCQRLLDAGVIAHPGYFFDFPIQGHLVLSLIVERRDFSEGLSRLASVLATWSES